ncbi:hypothetical protein BO71DRAFT_395453 [Aspergillus ellipticus CBS 707.79]|uniref:Uncharacterized protein n=1 Tax=Aspergillus ellipticus CBS 707.79 TaxID=1448320 RepID=A0A319DL86_9EURO|nr:hypothetical protein BO71DRAFT_395453 [Aspergillus ellipticus CBS 707.79]
MPILWATSHIDPHLATSPTFPEPNNQPFLASGHNPHMSNPGKRAWRTIPKSPSLDSPRWGNPESATPEVIKDTPHPVHTHSLSLSSNKTQSKTLP